MTTDLHTTAQQITASCPGWDHALSTFKSDGTCDRDRNELLARGVEGHCAQTFRESHISGQGAVLLWRLVGMSYQWGAQLLLELTPTELSCGSRYQTREVMFLASRYLSHVNTN